MGKKHGLLLGIEAKIEYHPTLEALGVFYEALRRKALNWLQSGLIESELNESEVEKRLQKEYGIQWAWADSISNEAKQTLDQLKTAKDNNIIALKERIKAKEKKASETQKYLTKQLKKGFRTVEEREKFKVTLLGLKQKVLKVCGLKKDLEKLEKTDRLHICFGSKKLFSAQHHLKISGFNSHEEWLEEWRAKRSGRFYMYWQISSWRRNNDKNISFK